MKETSNTQQAFWVSIGQFSAFAVGFISPMILSRYFDKPDYGTYKQVMYVYQTLLIVFTLGLPRAYSFFIPRVSLAESKDVVRKISNIFIILGLALGLMIYLGAPFFADILKNPDLELALKFFAPTPLFLLPVMGIENILASYKRAKLIALFSLANRLLILLVSTIPVVIFKSSYIGAIIGFDIASFLTFILSYFLKYHPTKDIKRERTIIKYSEIFRFSFPLMLASIWIMIFQSSNQFFISRYFGSSEFAEYSNGFTELPFIPMIVNSVAIVITPVFSNLALNSPDEISEVWRRALVKTIKLVYPIAAFSMIFANLIMDCIYGPKYINSGIYFAIRNIECYFSVIPFFPVLMALNKNKEYSYVHLLFALLIIPLDFIVIKLFDCPYYIVTVFIICAVGKVISQFLLVSKYTKISILDLLPFSLMVKTIAVAFTAGLIPYIIIKCLPEVNAWHLLFLIGVIYAGCYLGICHLFHLTYKDIIGSKLKSCFLYKFIP